MSLLDDNFNVMDADMLGDMCINYYRKYFHIHNDIHIKFMGYGRLKFKNILKHPSRYVIADLFSHNNVYEVCIKVCKKGVKSTYEWAVYDDLTLKKILNNKPFI